jgi:4-amino-4-deoxy-L-arabinose transferase-like glycosyltransferase
MTFMGDEGRDALVVKEIIINHNIPLIGPPTSVSTGAGSVYLGPLYYYMMAISMWLSGLNPVGAALMVASIGVLSVALIYYLSRVWFGKEAALLTGFAYAISTVVVAYSRTSWNPNPAPFFAMLVILGLYKSFQTKNFLWFILTGIALAFAVQMHYLASILLPVSGLLWAWHLHLKVNKKYPFRFFVSGTIISIVSFLVLMSPLVLFDIKHEFTNFNALKSILLGGKSGVNLNPFENLLRIFPIYSRDLVGMYLAVKNTWVSILMSVIVPVPLIAAVALKLKGQSLRWPIVALAVWLIFGLIGLSLYNQELPAHYLGFLSPVPFLLLGGFIYYLPQKLKYPFVGLLALLLVLVNLPKNPLMFPPGNQLERTQNIARFIIKISDNKPFNFTLIAEHNYDAAYWFYLDQYGHTPKTLPDDMTKQLLIVCEEPVCNPVVNSKYEIVAFGSSVQDQEYDLYGVKIFKLSHNPKQ